MSTHRLHAKHLGVALAGLAAIACHKSANDGPITGTIARFDTAALTSASDFYGLPFPSNLRLDGVGIGISGFPNPENSPLLQSYIAALHDSVTGFGTAAPMYVGFNAPIDPSSLPTDPALTLVDTSPVQVIDIDNTSGTAGTRIPIQFNYYAAKTLFVAANTLALRPVPGAPLLSNHQYALVVTTALHDTAGKPVVADALTRMVLGRTDPISSATNAIAITQPFNAWAAMAKFDLDQVALVSVFNTQDAVGTMPLVRTIVRAAPAPTISNLAFAGDSNQTHRFTGTFSVMNFQQGLPPYISSGGGFVFDSGGNPIPQRTEQVRFALTVPKGTPPASGWPLIIYAHGTGGSYLSFSEEYANDGHGNDAMADAAARSGMASLCMDQVLHGPRNPSCDETSPTYETCVGTDFYNFVNPYAGRDNTRQGGADNLQLIRLAHELTVPAAIDPENIVPTLDTSRIVFLGHSQGSETGAPFAAAEPELKAAVFSGAGGVVTITILERKDPLDFKSLAETLLGITGLESLEPFHPVLALVQTFIEPADTINYARAFQQAPLNGGLRDSLLLEGMMDMYVPQETAEALGAAALFPIGGIVQHKGPAFLAFGLPVLPLPISNNISLTSSTSGSIKRTGALLQFPNDNHFAMFDNAQANCQVMNFLKTSLSGNGATIPLCTP